ncbi:ATPase [Desulfurivibrio sp. D14AmB]|uniref:ATPase n=1 Tax=Desulfurivibrio sp. D14AmB TaxID=3374370 RepID=UPI00376F2488
MIIGDFGTSYSKILDLGLGAAGPAIIATRELPPETRVDVATGHNARRFGHTSVNELVALARGGQALIDRPDFLLLDCGSRDIKFIRYKNGKLADMGWNAECGASMGFTIELLERYYQLDCQKMEVPKRSFSVTCGVLGLSDIFDAVVNGVTEEEAVARLIKGIALNAYRFAGEPEQLYLSGGLCDNPVFVGSLPCRVNPLGRFVLLEGLSHGL